MPNETAAGLPRLRLLRLAPNAGAEGAGTGRELRRAREGPPQQSAGTRRSPALAQDRSATAAGRSAWANGVDLRALCIPF